MLDLLYSFAFVVIVGGLNLIVQALERRPGVKEKKK